MKHEYSEQKLSVEAPMVPSAEQLLEAVLELAREAHISIPEHELVGRFLGVLGGLFPRRLLAVRVFDSRTIESAGVYTVGCKLRASAATDPVPLKRSSVEKTRMKSAVAASSRLRISERWDAPFADVAKGFAVPLVAAGELYGVLDVGYPLGLDLSKEDEPLILPIANHLSLALRNLWLHRESTVLRDYQARIIEQANALILSVDRKWRIMVCNRALCDLTGYKQEEMLGRDLRDWLPGAARARLESTVRMAFDGASADAIDTDLPTAAGGKVRAVWSVAPVGGRTDVNMVVAIGQDQTRLVELQNQVIQAEKLATLGQLAAGVVHELNNPLTSISVYAEYLLRKAEMSGSGPPVDAGDVDKLSRIAAGAQRILSFARDLVQYAKPAGTEFEVVDLNTVVRQALSFCEHLFERSEIALRCELEPTSHLVFAVSGQLEQVLINLVTNAVHACGESGNVIVEITDLADDGVELSVSDDGPGLEPADAARIFEPFFTTKVDGKGTGLGLSIAKNIVEQHRGRIHAELSPSGGARFVCFLPRARR